MSIRIFKVTSSDRNVIYIENDEKEAIWQSLDARDGECFEFVYGEWRPVHAVLVPTE